MAKIKRSLIGREIHGTLAKTLVLRTRGKRLTISRLTPPSNPRSPAQLAHRAIFQAGIETWHTLTDAEKALYAAINPRIGYNPAYLNFMGAWLMGIVPIHHTRHESGGADEISLTGMLGVPAQLYLHQALLNAHTRHDMELRREGEYIMTAPLAGVGTQALTTDHLYATPFPVNRLLTIDRLAFQVSTGDAGKSCRVGIYTNGTNCYPGDLLKDIGTALVTNVSIKAVVIAGAQQLPKGLYWLVVISDGTPTLYRQTTPFTPLGWWSSDLSTARGGWDVAQAYGALPSSYPLGGSLYTKAYILAPRLKTLD